MSRTAEPADSPSQSHTDGLTPSICATCSVPRDAHDRFRHPFNDGTRDGIAGLGVALNAQGDQIDGPATDDVEVVEMSWPFDPVLRQALVDKGIITADDLRDAERKIKDMSAIFNGRL